MQASENRYTNNFFHDDYEQNMYNTSTVLKSIISLSNLKFLYTNEIYCITSKQ